MIRSPAAKPASIVGAMKAMAGASPKDRASFAKGHCVRGIYIPSDRADEVTKSQSFTRPSRVLARFSVDGGNPLMPDTDNFVLRGFSFTLGDIGHRSDILTQSAPVHYARTTAQMLAYLKARIPGSDGRPDPEKIKAFSTANPETLHQASYMAAHALPASFADTTYWAVHAFPATNRSGETQFIKFKVVPVGSQAALAEDAVTTNGGLLRKDLENRIAARDIRFSLMAVLGRLGDPILDVTIRWPHEDRRETVRLGTIVITAIEANEAPDGSVFNPADLAEGIGYPPDQIFAARRAAYAISLTRRR
ncbi:catalase [Bradyrhizobium shewense]|uniref:catalase n=1 Tax=Bradyrhizobium shewense TaxID=1761772 RepID=A0A1C3TW83_9BRAD|nr:catalase [Bradyrhizobium shewense]SCB07474.1 catalase [Bradyrhizobium shewense]